MRKYLLHVLIISFIFLLAPTAQAASYEDEKRIEDAKEVVRNNPDDADAHFYLASAYQRARMHKKSIESYKQALRLDPDSAQRYIHLANAYGRVGENEKFVKLYKKALKIDPYNGIVHMQLGFKYAEMGDIDLAFEEYKILKKLDTELAEALDESISETKEMERQRRIYEAYEGRNY